MQFKKIIPILGLSLLGGLASCNNESETYEVLFSNLQTGENFKINVPKGETIYDVTTDTSELDDFISDDTYELEGWYYTIQDANELNRGENDVNVFSYDTPINEDIQVYAGIAYKNFPSEVKEVVSSYLGTYETLDISPIPLLKTDRISVDKTNLNSFTFENVSQSTYDTYLQSLVDDYHYTLVSDNTYLDTTESYLLELNCDESSRNLVVSYRFNDEVGKFPSKYFASNFAGIDYSMYINDDSFMLAENDKDNIDNKFLTREVTNGDITFKTIFYTPKSSDLDPVTSLGDYLENNNFQLAGTNMYVDQFGSAVTQIGSVSNVPLFQNLEGVTNEMLYIATYSVATSSIDEESLSESYAEYTNFEYPTDTYPLFDGAKLYGVILGYTYSSYTGPGLNIFGLTTKQLDNIMLDLEEKGWNISMSDLSNYYSYTCYSPTEEYGIRIQYYEEDRYIDLNTSIATVVYFHHDTAFDRASVWFRNQNIGGGTITNIPKFDAYSYGSGYLNNGSSSISYTYYIIGTEVTTETYNAYLETLVNTNEWVRVSDTVFENTSCPTFNSVDGYYTIIVLYDSDSQKMTVQIYYNATTNVTTGYNDVINKIKARLQNENLVVPGLETLIGETDYKPVTVSQYYDGTNNRVNLTLYYDTLEEAEEAYNKYYEALNNSGYANAGTNSSGIEFYKETTTNTYYYGATGESTNNDVTSYYLLIGIYR